MSAAERSEFIAGNRDRYAAERNPTQSAASSDELSFRTSSSESPDNRGYPNQSEANAVKLARANPDDISTDPSSKW